ncbi:MAG TPA: endonuclease/exonuclease/phosphatase family protein [Vicinamibacterales bacterium]|nr:endonuclease/exonuclease/phosphatase family protein [Vicinamibacterales bacterium]
MVEPPARHAHRAPVDLRIVTYNIHRCRGMDRRVRPDRIAAVLSEIDADVIALQEVVGAGPHDAGQAAALGAALGMGWVMAPARHLRGHLFGNVVLSRYPVKFHTQHDLSWKTCEPRCAQRADLQVGDQVVHLYNVHLGTAVLERRHQARRLAAIVRDHRVLGPKIVLGDFNEWLRGLATATLSSMLRSIDIYAHLRRRRTYPGVFPILHLDHIYYEGAVEVRGVELPRSPKVLIASDHLPLVADLRVR